MHSGHEKMILENAPTVVYKQPYRVTESPELREAKRPLTQQIHWIFTNETGYIHKYIMLWAMSYRTRLPTFGIITTNIRTRETMQSPSHDARNKMQKESDATPL